MKVLYKAVKYHINNWDCNIGKVIMKANRKMAFRESRNSEKIKSYIKELGRKFRLSHIRSNVLLNH